MPRSGWVKPVSGRRLSDLVSVGVLTLVVPPDLVDEVIAAAGRTEQRHRSLPARVMAYFAIGMGLYSEGSYEDVLSQLTDGLSWASGWAESFTPPSKSAIFQARARLGSKPLEALFARVSKPVGTAGMSGVWLAGRRLVAIDGSCLDVADSPVNAALCCRRSGDTRVVPLRSAPCWPTPLSTSAMTRTTSFVTALGDHPPVRGAPGALFLPDDSEACTEVFSSMHSTTAFSGGFKYKPTTSISFSSNRGSPESLNVLTRCGFRPRPDQIRCPVAGLTATALAIDRQLECVAPAGLSCWVRCTIWSTFSHRDPRLAATTLP